MPGFRRFVWILPILAAIIVPAIAADFVELPVRDSDKTEAARSLVAWIVDGRTVPGFGEAYADAQWMPAEKHFFVVCEFLPPEVSLSGDYRVRRVTAAEEDNVYKEYRFQATDYIRISLISESQTEFVLAFSNAFGTLAKHWYRFEFRRKVWGLRAAGMMSAVS